MNLEVLFDALGAGGAEGHKLASTSPLVNHQSPTSKRYQGHLLLGQDRHSEEIIWIGMCSYGPGNQPHAHQTRVYQGKSLAQACAAVNNRIQHKIGRGYEALDGIYPRLLEAREIIQGLPETGEASQSSPGAALEEILGHQG